MARRSAELRQEILVREAALSPLANLGAAWRLGGRPEARSGAPNGAWAEHERTTSGTRTEPRTGARSPSAQPGQRASSNAALPEIFFAFAGAEVLKLCIASPAARSIFSTVSGLA